MIVNCMVAAEDFRTASDKAAREQIALDEAEQATLGFAPTAIQDESSAEAWKIPAEIIDAIPNSTTSTSETRSAARPLVALSAPERLALPHA